MASRLVSFFVVLTIGIFPGESPGAEGTGLFLGAVGPAGGAASEGSSSVGSPGVADVGSLFAEEPRNVVVKRGSGAVLACSARLPLWTASWLKDGGPLTADSNHTVGVNGSLTISRTRPRDVGEYRCVLKGPLGVVLSRAASLEFASLSSDVHGPINVTILRGGTARFSCSIDSVPPARITWKKNDKLLPAMSRYVTLSSGTLFIINVESSDEGNYRCVAINDLLKKSRASYDAHLKIGSPSLLTPNAFPTLPKKVEISKGTNLSLECPFYGDIVPLWTFIGKDHGANQSETILKVKDEYILSINNVQEKHSGIYNCTCKMSTAILSQLFEVDVLVPPSILKPPQSQTYPSARTARFNCDVSGVPFPNITWYKNGVKLEKRNGRVKVQGKELLISSSIVSDTGLYQCMAQNTVGESWGVGYFNVTSSGLQDPPSNLTCQMQGESFISVQWNAPLEEVKAYTVYYSSAGGEVDGHKLVDKPFCNVTGLTPFTNYTFYVRSYVSRGASEPSHEVTCETKESVPEAAPRISLTIVSPTKLQVSWLPPDLLKTFGRITEYKVQWRQVTRSTSKVKEVPAKVLNYTITDLIPGNKYEIRVLARTSRGWPKPSVEKLLEWLPVRMPLQSTSNVASPMRIHLTAINESCIEVKWDSSGFSSNFLKEWKVISIKQDGSSSESEPLLLPRNVSKAFLFNLEPHMYYDIKVFSVSLEGVKEVGSQQIRTHAAVTLQDQNQAEVSPEAPKGLEAEPTSPQAINLTWSSPSSHVNVDYYSVSIKVVHTIHIPGFTKTIAVNGSFMWVEIKDLQPNTIYELKVKLYDVDGRSSNFSEKIECRTFEDAPGMVADVVWKPLNSTTLRVMWKEPTNPVAQFHLSLLPADNTKPIELLVGGSQTSTEVSGLKPYTAYQLTVSGITRGGSGPPSSAQTVFVSAPSVMESPAGEQFASHFPAIPWIIGVILSIAAVSVLIVILVFMKTCKAASNGSRNGLAPAQSSYQSNGNGVHTQFPLTSFVEDLNQCQNYDTSHIDMETHEMNGKTVEECSVTLLPPGTIPTPIGANISQSFEIKPPAKADDSKTSTSWNVGALPRHLFHITENPQYDTKISSKIQPLCYGHDRLEPENQEEKLTLLSVKPDCQHPDSDLEDECSCDEEVEEDLACEALNITQMTDIDNILQDKSNNNRDSHDNNLSTNSSHSSVNESESSNSFLGDCIKDGSNPTQQQLLVTLSSVPLHHLSKKPLIDLSKVSVVGPNG